MKTTKITGYHVVVDPRSLGDFGGVRLSEWAIEPSEKRRLNRYQGRCEEMVEQIRRHVDNVRDARVVEETEAFCAYCGSEWTEAGDAYNGGCCDEDDVAHRVPIEQGR